MLDLYFRIQREPLDMIKILLSVIPYVVIEHASKVS